MENTQFVLGPKNIQPTIKCDEFRPKTLLQLRQKAPFKILLNNGVMRIMGDGLLLQVFSVQSSIKKTSGKSHCAVMP